MNAREKEKHVILSEIIKGSGHVHIQMCLCLQVCRLASMNKHLTLCMYKHLHLYVSVCW